MSEPTPIDTSNPLLEITPGDIKIHLQPNKDHVVELKLKNLTSSDVAFKVKTTAPDKYQVRPIQAIVNGGETTTCMIVLKGMPPPLESMKHKFLIQSLTHDGVTPISQFWKTVETNKREDKRPTFHDQRIVCSLIGQEADAPAAPTSSASSAAAVSTPVVSSTSNQLQTLLDEKTKEFDGLMDFTLKQNGQIKQLTTQLQQKSEENDTLKRTVQQLEKANAMASNGTPGPQNVSEPVPVSVGVPMWAIAVAFVAGVVISHMI